MSHMWIRVFGLVLVGILSGCRTSGPEPTQPRNMPPGWDRSVALWRVHHGGLVRALGEDRTRLRESHQALLEELIVLKHLDGFERAAGWDRILDAYRDLLARALGGVSPRVLELRYAALRIRVEKRIGNVLETSRS